MTELPVIHHRKERPPIAGNAFPDGSRDFPVRPRAEAGFSVGSEVRGDELSRDLRNDGEFPPGQKRFFDDEVARTRLVDGRVAGDAAEHVVR
jgi:hypothetical protein